MHCEFLFTEQRKQPCVLMVEDVLPQQRGRSPLYRPLALFTFCMEHVLVLIKLSSTYELVHLEEKKTFLCSLEERD